MYRLGIDLGGTNIVAGVVDAQYNILSIAKRKTNSPRPCEEIADDIAAAATEAIEKAGIRPADIAVAGIGAPGDIDVANGVILLADNLRFVNVPLVAMLEERLGIRFYIQNDANAAAYGEYVAGAGNGTRDFVMVMLGTGIGGGVIVDRKIYGGFSNKGAELGHSVIDMNGDVCSCGRRGCWEAYASASALIRQTKKAMLENKESALWQFCNGNIDAVNGRTAFDAMRAGDATAKQVVDTYIRYVAVGIADIVYVFRPDMVCIGGGISNEGDGLIAPLYRHVQEQVHGFNPQHDTRIAVSRLGDKAGILGAAFISDLYA